MPETERDLERLPHEDVLEFQVTRIRELMEGQWQKAAGFTRRLAEAGVTTEDLVVPDDIRKFPLLRKSHLTEIQGLEPPFGGLITVPPGRLRRIYSSPGPSTTRRDGHLLITGGRGPSQRAASGRGTSCSIVLVTT